jgi:hypothetical protein
VVAVDSVPVEVVVVSVESSPGVPVAVSAVSSSSSDGVDVGVEVDVGVGADDGVAVGVVVGVGVSDGVGVGVSDGVGVGVEVDVTVSDGVGEDVGVAVAVSDCVVVSVWSVTVSFEVDISAGDAAWLLISASRPDGDCDTPAWTGATLPRTTPSTSTTVTALDRRVVSFMTVI